MSVIGLVGSPVQAQQHELILDTSHEWYGSLAVEIRRVHHPGSKNYEPMFQVFTGECPPKAGKQPLWGKAGILGERAYFQPRLPFEPGLDYCYSLIWASDTVSGQFKVEHSSNIPARLLSVFPQQVTVPANILKFYLKFSHPMGGHDPYHSIHLINQTGDTLKQAFYPANPALWDPERTRLTLLFDPGRIKRGLVPNAELGLALEANQEYTIALDPSLTDASGHGLAGWTKFHFRTTQPDHQVPVITRWQVTPPASGTRQALVLKFDEPMDYAQLQRWIRIRDSTDTLLEGDISIAPDALSWSFQPEQEWLSGLHYLEVYNQLEDLAGNSLRKPFELAAGTAENLLPPDWIKVPVDLKP